MTSLGDRLFGDDIGNNKALVEQVRTAVAARSAAIPVLLIPVRIETRFTRTDVPVGNTMGPSHLLRLAQVALVTARSLTNRQYATTLPKSTVERRGYKRGVEDPLIGDADTDLDTLTFTLAAADVQLRLADPADLAATTLVATTLANVAAAIGTGAAALSGLRSPFHRDRLVGRLPAVGDQLGKLVTAVTTQAVPAGALIGSLVGATRLGIPHSRLVDSGIAYAALDTELGQLEQVAATLTQNAADPVAVQRAYRDAAVGDRLQHALEHIATIAALPTAWQQQLAGRVGRLQTSLATALQLVQLNPVDHRDLLDRLPIAVGAVRTDTAVGTPAPGAPSTQTVDELRVRIFPDEFAVHTHEAGLTAAEAAAGAAYWQATANAGGDDIARRAAWRIVAARHGPARGAWVVRQTSTAGIGSALLTGALTSLDVIRKRLDEASANPVARAGTVRKAMEAAVTAANQLGPLPTAALARLHELVAVIDGKLNWLQLAGPGVDSVAAATRFADLRAIIDAVPVADPPATPVSPATRDSAWTAQPKAIGLPERFVVVTVAGGAVGHIVAGAAVDPAGVAVGPDPAAVNDPPFTVNPDGSTTVGASMRWLVDYAAAASAGLAVTVRITAAEAQAGFDRVYVIGLTGGDPTTDQQHLQALLDNHHYTARGLALLATGTPTNSTERAATPFSSAENADRAFDLELGPAKVGSGGANPTDGWRLAHALGISPGTLDHIERADATDITEAQLATAALWPGTAGYAVEELLGSVIGVDAQDRLRSFATGAVIGRGSLPAIRVGPQPYGVLATTAYTRFVPDGGATLPASAVSDADRQLRFDILLRDVLLLMHQDWTAARRAHVPHAFSGGVTDPQNHLLAMLGLDATSVSYGQRFAVNAGKRGTGVGPIHLNDPLSLTSGPFALLNRFVSVLSEANRIPVGPLIVKGAVALAYQGIYDALDASRGFEVRYLDQAIALPEGIVTNDVGARITALLQQDLEDLGRDAATPASDQPLLVLLLRQALLVQARDTAARILEREGVIAPGLRPRIGGGDLFAISRIGFRKNVTRWSFLLMQLSVLHEALGGQLVPAGGALYGYLNQQSKRMDDLLAGRAGNALAQGYAGLAAHQGDLNALAAHAGTVSSLAALPSDRLAEITREHLDICSHRLDAWILGLANRRLLTMRAVTPTGVHLGAFGWVEDLLPGGQLTVATDVPAVLTTNASTVIRSDPANQGFVHAPSLPHAAAAAILRSGYLAHGAASRMAVNVSSRRVRAALALLDGIGAGNDLGALLGYQFERDLHDAYDIDGIALDDLIVPLRRRFPSVVPLDATATTADEDLRAVVDGYALLTLVQDWMRLHAGPAAGTLLSALQSGGYAAYPYGLAGVIPDLSEADRLNAMLAAIDRLADTVDALGDLVVTEGVYQIVQGNQPRAAAALSALGTGRMPPVPEVIDTPVAGARVTHRVLVQLPVDRGLPTGWAVPSARSAAEPTLNYWLGDLLGPAGMTWAQVVDEHGAPVGEVTLAALPLQPIDLLAILHHGLEDARTELSVRILDTLRPLDVREGEPAPPMTLSLERDPAWPADVRSLAETAALLETIGTAVTHGRAATSADYVLVDTVVGVGAPLDLAELGQRAAAAAAALQAVGVQLLRVLSDGADSDPALLVGDVSQYVTHHAPTYRGAAAAGDHLARLDALWLRRNEFRSALLAALGFDIPGVRLPAVWATRDQVASELLEAAEGALVEVAGRLGTVAGHLAATDANTAAGLRRTLAALFTESLPVFPRFTLSNAAELTAGLAAPAGSELAVQGWLPGVMAVREPVAAFGTAVSLAGAFGSDVPEGVAVQLPMRSGEPWLGEAGPTAPGDRLSLVIYRPDELVLDGSAGVGLLVDEWTETLPAAELTTGVSFHYDQPDSQPPQTLLLVVPPAVRPGWLWEDLVQTLHDTLELAKNRAVEPVHLQDSVYGPLLPALIGDIPPFGPTGGLSDHRIVLDFGAMQSGGA